MKILKHYFIPFSTENVALFDDLRDNDFIFAAKPYNEEKFELYIEIEARQETTLEEIMKWYI